MLLDAAAVAPSQAARAAQIASVIVERGMGGTETMLDARLARFQRDRSTRADEMRRLATGWVEQAAREARRIDHGPAGLAADAGPAALLARAWPDRIARARGGAIPGHFLLANGRGAMVDAADPLAKAAWLAVAELTGSAQQARILLAAPMDEAEAMAIAGGRVRSGLEAGYDPGAAAVRARRVRRLDAIVLASDPAPLPPDLDSATLLAEGVARHAMARLPWNKAAGQLRDRIGFLRRAHGAEGAANPWPDVSDEALARSAADWLAPFLTGKSALAEIGADDLHAALAALLSREQKKALDAEAPTHFEAPTGSSVAVDYAAEGGPAIAIRVQELYGLSRHPSLAGGRVPLTLHLLSPAHRPIQITKDLPGFWAGSWSAVKTEMKGRYPRHVWPDDPARALPTTRAKPRGT
jgi:ATP-dependent helicase HrpB